MRHCGGTPKQEEVSRPHAALRRNTKTGGARFLDHMRHCGGTPKQDEVPRDAVYSYPSAREDWCQDTGSREGTPTVK